MTRTPGEPTRGRTFWQRRVRDPIVAQLTQGITADKIALSLSIGSTCALFPIFGTTSLLCLIFGILLKLNQPIMQMVNILCTPIHIPLFLYFVYIGQVLFGDSTETKLSMRYYMDLFWDSPEIFFRRFGGVVWHTTIIWMVFAPFWAAGVYYISLPLLRGIARVRAENAAKLVAQKPPDHPVP